MIFLSQDITFKKILASIPIIIVIGGGCYLYYRLYSKFIESASSYKNIILQLKQQVSILENSLASSTQNNINLTSILTEEQKKSIAFSNNIQQIQGTVDSLVKLSKTDPEFLKKYSKVYFLNENYAPAKITEIDKTYLFDKTRQLSLDASVWPFMQKLLQASDSDGMQIKIASAYRSFGEQSSLKNSYKITYGTGSNKFSADQGYSEHQLGTTIDFTTLKIGGALLGFEKTHAFTWLQGNAYKHGFILSYPKTNVYYQFEPWHWRFVGISLATSLHNNGKNFYDLDQRAIDLYLISIFDEQ